ncbi:MAG: copper amine oxidase N-terminal domain-containing protein [Defluviitaleaceae bacterium]|nr:copper amine oxidase N-terminal domain-containing protein [Defluviitaleaceae bacterium]
MKKNYRFILAFLLTVAFLSTSVFSLPVMANDVRVFMDGVELDYTYVQPHIVNDRTMVPLRETAEHFGMEFTWSPELATMTFTGHGRTIIHTVFSDTLFINGEPMIFDDMTSIVANDRTLMPLRMIAYAIGAAVDWDPSGIVDIWTGGDSGNLGGSQQNQNNEQGQGNQTTPPPAGGEARVIEAAVARLNHEFGEPILVRVETTRATERVRITDFSEENVLAESSEFTEDFQGRYFNIYVTPEESGEITLRVQAGNASGFAMSAANIRVNVAPEVGASNIQIFNLSTSRTNFNLQTNNNRRVEGTIRTSQDVVRIEAQNAAGRHLDRVTRYETSFANFLTWEFEFEVDNTNGTRNYYIVAFDANGNYERRAVSVTVTGGVAGSGSGGTTTTQTGRIASVTFQGSGNTVIHQNNSQYRFTVTTDNTVNGVEVRGRDNRWLGSVNFHNVSGNQRVFDVPFSAYEIDPTEYWIYVRHGENDNWYGRRVRDFISGFTVNP